MAPWRFKAALLALLAAQAAHAADIAASPPQKLSVTIYRAPYRNAGSINLTTLGGFALITETRTVHLSPGESRLRFEGVADGILPASAIVTGLPDGVIEKNRDAAVLSPESLIRAALGAQVSLQRTDPKSGKTTAIPATIRSADDSGVVFQTAEGVEALKCSGLAETFSFDRVPAGLSSTPTLSVLTRSTREVTATVTLAYLAEGFDWAANYVASVAPDGGHLNLKAWITLANNNSVSLPAAHTQIVAGRLNREWEARLEAAAPRVIAKCWPQGTTSDEAPPPNLRMVHPYMGPMDVLQLGRGRLEDKAVMEVVVGTAAAPRAMAPPPPPPPPEQLGDLKLYRVPETTTIAARQMKQVRLLEAADVPVTRLVESDLAADGDESNTLAETIIRTKNDLADKLGLPLPSGGVAVFDEGSGGLLLGETTLRDLAEDEDVELKLGPSPAIHVRQTRLRYTAASPEILTLAPDLKLAVLHGQSLEEVEISNDRLEPVPYELRLQTGGTERVVSADQPMDKKDGRPIFRLTLPPNGSVSVRYAVADR